MASKIEWTEETWNPITGCSKISSGCKHCYAEIMARRLQAMRTKGYEKGFELTLQSQRILEPLHNKKPTMYFVNSMSDLFHENVPFSFIDSVFETIKKAYWHKFQVLTKRANIMAEYFSTRQVPKNVWLGVTVENKKEGLPRISLLKSIPNVSIKFLSIEPLLEDLGIVDFSGINWVIVGGESGQQARPMKKEWAVNIKNQCEEQNIAFYFKQWGSWGEDMKKRSKKANGHLLDNEIYREMPQTND